MPFTLGSNQFFDTFPWGAMQNEIQLLFFLSAQEKNNQISLKVCMSNMTRESFAWGLCINIMRTDKLAQQKEMKQGCCDYPSFLSCSE